jgi:hypothetical protein
MSNISQLTDLIEEKVLKLQDKLVNLAAENKALKQAVAKLHTEKEATETALNELKKQNDALKVANRILGSKEHTTETKLKINALIREIDACILQLSK